MRNMDYHYNFDILPLPSHCDKSHGNTLEASSSEENKAHDDDGPP